MIPSRTPIRPSLLPTANPIVLAVVGAGGWGRNHVRTFASLAAVELRYVCDRSEAARESVSKQWPWIRTVEDFSTVLADPEVRAVVVATDAASHYDHAKLALERDIDVFVEKPLTLSGETSAALVRLAAERGRILMVGHLLLYHPAVEYLKKLIEQGELGDVLYLVSQRLNLGVVRKDENAWWSLAPHDLAVANYLLGAEPRAVTSSGGAFLQRERGIEDVVFATVQYPPREPGGAPRLAHIHVSWLDPHKTRRLTVVGSKKMAVFDDASPDQKLTLFDKGVTPPPTAASYEEGVRIRTGDIVIPAMRMQEPLMRECEAFVQAVRTRVAPAASGASGLSVVRILEAGSKSLHHGGARVDLGEDAR